MRAFLFDFDGVIADSEPLHIETFRETLAPLGIRVDEKRWYKEFAGRGSPYIMEVLLGEAGITGERKVKGYVDKRRKLFERRVQEGMLTEKRGLGKFLDDAKKAGVSVAVVSGGHKQNVVSALKMLGIDGEFGPILCCEDYVKNKPDPECYLKAAAMLGAKPAECVVFEDSESGCMSAKNAGMRIVLVESRVPPEGCSVMMVIRDFTVLKVGDVLARAGI